MRVTSFTQHPQKTAVIKPLVFYGGYDIRASYCEVSKKPNRIDRGAPALYFEKDLYA